MKRYKELDSIRGLASLSVVFHHCLLAFPVFYLAHFHQPLDFKWYSNTPLHLFWAGHEAVILFFVLSGFVLALPFLNREISGYFSYIVRRVCRIYIPYIVSILISIALLNIIGKTDIAGLSDWFKRMWDTPLNMKMIIKYLLMTGENTHNLNTVTWSLIHELRISLIFPFIMILVIKWDWKKTLVLSLSTSVIFMILLDKLSMEFMYHVNVSYWLKSMSVTFYYCAFFIIGATFAKYREVIKDYTDKISGKGKILLSVSALFFYLSEWLIPGIGLHKYHGSYLKTTGLTIGIDLGIAFSVLLLFSLIFSSMKLRIILTHSYLLFLGKISFSLYLIHPIVLLSFVYLMNGLIPLSTLIIIVPIVSIILSGFMYKYVELPSITLGKRLSKKNVTNTEINHAA